MSRPARARWVLGSWAMGLALVLSPALWRAQPSPGPPPERAQRILEASGIKGGLVVHLGCGDGKLTAALCANDSYLVHGLDVDAKNVAKAREHIRSRGLHGKVSVQRWRERRLPYADNLVNLLVSEARTKVPMDEVMRVLVPDGVAYISKGRKWTKTVKPRPKEIDEWTHYLHDGSGNAVGHDSVVGPPGHLQWVTGPVWSRHHDTVPSVSAMVSSHGRLFCISDEAPPGIDESLPDKWFLVARDAFNGVLLWKRPMPEWGWNQWSATWHGRFNQPTQLTKRLVAVGDTVYVTLGFHAPLTALDAATGEVLRTYEGTERTDEILCHQGLLILATNHEARAPDRENRTPVRKSVCVVEADTGKTLWRKGDYRGLHSKADSVEPFGRLEMVVGDGRIFLADQDAIIGLDLKSGDEHWRVPRPAVPEYVALFSMRMNDLCVLVYHDGVLLFAQPEMAVRDPWHSIPGTLYALSAKTGKPLWKHRYGGWAHFYQPDVFVIGGLVWIHEHADAQEGQGKELKKHQLIPSQDELDYAVLGLDPTTGEVKRRFATRETFNVGHHHRCYRNKATERFLLTSRRGVEFLDLETGENQLHHWARGGCLFGIVPCNGLLYLTPHPCECYIATKLNGFFALAPRMPGGSAAQREPRSGRPERGPAYGASLDRAAASGPDDWPTYRHDPRRSGSTTSALPADLRVLWQARIGGRLSPVATADGKLFVASIDEHRVVALDASRGRPVWSFTAGGRVDTPPTIHRGLALLGSADGWVYCLRASDGQLVWRRQAAPTQRLVGAFGQLESAWPVHGSILVKDDVAYLAAGRSSYLDGGIYVHALDPRTGEILGQQVIYSPDPNTGKMPPGDHRTIPGALADILVTDGSSVYMRQMKVLDGNEKAKPHVFSTAGFLDDTWFNRTRWAVGAVAHAQLLVFDSTSAYGVKAYPGIRRQNVFHPGGEGYVLFAGDLKETPPRKPPSGQKPAATRQAFKPRWQVRVPVRITAMALADRTLFVAGAPDVVDPTDPLGAFEGRKGGLLWTVSAADGKKLAEYELESPPVFDGMAAANGRLYISTRDGALLCLGKNE